MTKLIKGLALLLAVSCVVWIAVLWRWETTRADVGTEQILLYLVALPLAAFLGLLLLRWGAAGVAAGAAALSARRAAAAPAAGTPAAAAPQHEDAARRQTMQLLSAHLMLNLGDSPAQVLQAMKKGEPAPAPDAELRNGEGLPVIAARVPELDVATLEAAVEPLLPALRRQREEWAGQQPAAASLRALALLAPPLERVLGDLRQHAERLQWLPADDPLAPPAPPSLAGGPPAAVPKPPQLRVLLNLPAGMPAFDQALAEAWLLETFAQALPEPAARRVLLQLQPGSGPALWQAAEQLHLTLKREGLNDLVMLLATHSDIDPATVQQLEDRGQLFDAQRCPRGVMPGEAAAVLVLAAADWPPAPDSSAVPQHLHRAALVQRDKPIDAEGRINTDMLQTALEQALVVGQQTGEEVKALLSDADLHTARAAELYGAAQATLAALEPAEDIALLGRSSGRTGAVGCLASVALAAAQVNAEKPLAAVVSNADPHMRLALLARAGAPPVPPPAAAQAETKPSAA